MPRQNLKLYLGKSRKASLEEMTFILLPQSGRWENRGIQTEQQGANLCFPERGL